MARNFDLSQWARPEMLALKPYTSARDTFTATEGEWTFLDANENPNSTVVHRYPDPNQTELKNIFANLRGCNEDQLLIGNGSDEVLDLIVRAFCTPHKDEMVIMPPTYGMYAVLADINSVGLIEVPLDATFQLKPKEILAAVTPNTKAIFFCSPNNPSGNAFNADDIKALLDNFDGIIVIDEAYIDFTEIPSWSEKLSDYPNLIVTQTLSKAFGLAGLRLGIAIASPEIIALLKRIKPPYNINTLSQQHAMTVLRDTKAVNAQIVESIAERKRLAQELNAFSWVVTIYPSDANFLLIQVDDASRRYTELLNQHIVTRNRSSQENCENCIRISVGTPQENDNLIAACKSLSK
ncbi:MAG: histidinol-phosphate transaminase [Bacteroidetes bacterium]|nr:histidinol-phosphate transaminase [Bacteroidota bacterium]MDA0888051.1 histidinol-phosphate transaminase [Bacteroidota bacterium]MDA1084004.1 histidinol-phosphate transaminase [Bacteroidota bacterium]